MAGLHETDKKLVLVDSGDRYWVVIGEFILFFLFNSVSFYIESDFILIVIGFLTSAIVGAWIGLLQWLVLRGKVPSSGLWLLGSVVGWAFVGYAMYILMETDFEWFSLIPLGFMGMITGVVYAYLFTQPSKMKLGTSVVES